MWRMNYLHISKSFSVCLRKIFENITGMPLRGHLLAARTFIFSKKYVAGVGGVCGGGGSRGLWHIHFFKEIFLGGVRGGSGSMTYSSFPRNLSRGFQGFVTNLFFKEIFRERFAGISRVCDTFVFQDEKKKKFTGASRVCDTFVYQNKKNFSQ